MRLFTAFIYGIVAAVLISPPSAYSAAESFEQVRIAPTPPPRNHVLELRPQQAANSASGAASAPELPAEPQSPGIPKIQSSANVASSASAASAADTPRPPAGVPLRVFGTMAEAARAGIQPAGRVDSKPAASSPAVTHAAAPSKSVSTIARLQQQAEALLSAPLREWPFMLSGSPELAVTLGAVLVVALVLFILVGRRRAG